MGRESLRRALAALLCWFVAAPAAAQTYLPFKITEVGGGAFVSQSSSDLPVATMPIPLNWMIGSNNVDSALQVGPIDTSGWTTYDVTDSADASTVGCSVLDNTGTSDNTTNFRCWMQNIGDQALAYFPNGTYDIDDGPDSTGLFRPSITYDRRGIVGESRNAIINLTGDHTNIIQFILGEDRVLGTATSWNSGNGASSGAQAIAVASTAGFSTTEYADNNWVFLQANSNSTQDNTARIWITRVTCIDGATAGTGDRTGTDCTALTGDNQIQIEHPLPEDFDGGSATATPYSPPLEWVFRDFTVQNEQNLHQDGLNTFFQLKSMARVEITNVGTNRGYKQYLTAEWTADLYVAHSDFYGNGWDKSTNGYGMVLTNCDRCVIFDNHIEHMTGIAAQANSQLTIVYNDIRAPGGGCVDANEDDLCDSDGVTTQAFDVPCTGGDGNDCRIADHSGAHGTTVGSGYLHCSGSEDDVLGLNGDASCRGVQGGAVYSCIELHNAAASESLIMRNYCEGAIWYDDAFGPGRNNLIYGNWFADANEAGAPYYASMPVGELRWRSVGSPPAGYRVDHTFANNIFGGTFGGVNGFDAYGDGIKVLDNVFQTACQYQSSSSPPATDPSGGSCSPAVNNGVLDGTNTTWANNTVGANVHGGGYSRTMPSLPGFSDWPTFSVTPTITLPGVGPEMGNPDSTTKCLPAWQRYNGSC